MFDILLHNQLLIINILIPFIIGLYFVITHTEYSPKEFFIQVSLTTSILIGAFFLGYVNSDVYTSTYKTAKVNKFVYEESWTEKVTYQESYSCGYKNRSTCYRTKTRYDYHPDWYYYIATNNDIQSISKEHYLNAKKAFGEILTKRTHSNQSSFGDGKIYDIIPNIDIVHGYTGTEVNYIYASKTNIIKSHSFKELEDNFKNELKTYPKFYKDNFGNINYNRIINKNLIDDKLSENLQKQLETLSIHLGANPMIYLTTSTNREFAYIVKGFYQDKHFEDAMLVISVTDNKINWIESLSLTKSAEFKVYSTDLTDNFEDLVPKFEEVIKKYWKTPNLEDYSYLAGDINLPLWYIFIIIILNIVCSFFVFRYMFNHRL